LLLLALHEAGNSDAINALLARGPARLASLDDPQAIAELVPELRAPRAPRAPQPAGWRSGPQPYA
jgi:hypothetical protein